MRQPVTASDLIDAAIDFCGAAVLTAAILFAISGVPKMYNPHEDESADAYAAAVEDVMLDEGVTREQAERIVEQRARHFQQYKGR